MIFATLGTHHQPFARFIETIRPVAHRTFIQYGHNPPPSGFARAEQFLSFEEELAAMREAEAVVTHAGVGTILCTYDEGHIPIVIPRLHSLGEHVDDHQLELTRVLEESDWVEIKVLWQGEPLEPLLVETPSGPTRASAGGDELAVAIRDFLDGAPTRAPATFPS